MTLDEIKQLIDFIRERELSEFELEREDFKLRIKSGTVVHAAPPPAVSVWCRVATAVPRTTCLALKRPEKRNCPAWDPSGPAALMVPFPANAPWRLRRTCSAVT